MFDIADTTFSYEKELIFCSFLQGFSKAKGSSLQLICNAHTAFLHCGPDWKLATGPSTLYPTSVKLLRERFSLRSRLHFSMPATVER